MTKPIPRLPDSELTIMQAVWQYPGAVTRADIEAVLADQLAPTTILTLLSRLVERGFLSVTKSANKNQYRPLINQADYLASQSRTFLDKLCGGNLNVLANALCDSGLSREELDQLRQLLDRNEL